jgi:hypothetical protein
VVTPPAHELEPGIQKPIRFEDPDGFLVELVAGVDLVHDPFGARAGAVCGSMAHLEALI